MSEDGRRFEPRRLERLCLDALQAMGVRPEAAARTADCLVRANLQGVDTHGLARLPTYMRRLHQGAIDGAAQPAVVHRRGAVAVVDAGNALGPYGAHAGMECAAGLARESGVGFAAVRRGNHFSYAGYYCEWAAAQGLVGVCSSGGEPTMAPWGGIQAFFTNSPLAVGAPTSTDPFVVDLATSVSSRGRILLAQMLGTSIPGDWAIDARGQATTEPAAALAGSMLPMGGAKGYALTFALEILNGVLGGGALAPNVGSQAAQDGQAAGVTHFFLALDPDAFLERAAYLARIDALIENVRKTPAADPGQPVGVPGDRRRKTAEERSRLGIPLPGKLVDELDNAIRQYAAGARTLT